MKKLYNLSIIFLTGAIVWSCSSEDELIDDWIEANNIEVEAPVSGDLDLSRYISIGNSLAAGYADFALYDEAQNNSYPNLLANQFALAGGGAFNQPDINSENGYNTAFNVEGSGVIFGRTVLDLSDLAPVPTVGEAIGAFSGDKSSLSNFGVPGLRTSELEMPGYGFEGVGNPFFTRFAADPATSSVLGDALSVDRSFFSYWLGGNDYLVYASGGGQGDDPLTTYSSDAFAADLTSALTQLTAGGTPGVVLDLPPVVTLPFFQAVSYNAIPLDAATAAAVNDGLAAVNLAILLTSNAGYTDLDDLNRRQISFEESSTNPILVHDNDLEDLGPYFDLMLAGGAIDEASRALLVPYEQSRQLEPGELVLFTAASLLGAEFDGDDSVADTPIGVVIPLGFSVTAESNGDQYFLDAAEQVAIVTARATYNGVIQAVTAGFPDIELVSVQPTFVDMLGLDAATAAALALPTDAADGVSGIVVDGLSLSPDFAPNGIISTDGIHPAPRGQAIIANLIIDAINARWGATIPTIDVLALKGPSFQP